MRQGVGALAWGYGSLDTIIVVAQVYFACPRSRTAHGMVARIASALQLMRAGTATCGGSGIACCTWRPSLSLGIFRLPSKPCAALWRKRKRSQMRVDVLVIDEMGYLNLKPEQCNAFFKLMHERYAKRSTVIITTNLDYPQWYDFLGNKKMVKALLDRLRHRCHTIRIKGESLREPQG